MRNKKGQLITGTIVGIIGLVFTVILAFVMISQLNNSNLLTANSNEANASNRLAANFSSGVDNISSKVPTWFTIVSIVILVGFLLLLWRQMRESGLVAGGSTGGL